MKHNAISERLFQVFMVLLEHAYHELAVPDLAQHPPSLAAPMAHVAKVFRQSVNPTASKRTGNSI